MQRTTQLITKLMQSRKESRKKFRHAGIRSPTSAIPSQLGAGHTMVCYTPGKGEDEIMNIVLNLIYYLNYGMKKLGHFRVPPGLCFKTRVGVQPLIRKLFFIFMQIKLIFTWKVVHLASFWKWGILELGSGLYRKDHHCQIRNFCTCEMKAWKIGLPGFRTLMTWDFCAFGSLKLPMILTVPQIPSKILRSAWVGAK